MEPPTSITHVDIMWQDGTTNVIWLEMHIQDGLDIEVLVSNE